MDCTRTWDLLSDYLDGDLPEIDKEAVADHLRRCPQCAEEERALKETLSLLRNLPAEPAPPELLQGVRLRIEQESTGIPLWKRLFLPAHIKIPLEAAAVALIFALVYGIQKETPATKPPPAPPASVERAKQEPASVARPDRPKADLPREHRREAAVRELGEVKALGEPNAEASPEKERTAVADTLREKTASPASPRLPAVPATRVSTGGGAIDSAFPRETSEKEAPASRLFAAPPSRMLRSLIYGREVTIEVSPDARAGMENRIAELALRLGGAVRRERTRMAAETGGETRPLLDLLQVHLPSDSADVFLKELETLGTIPPEGSPGEGDISPGPDAGSVIYTVRIRVR